MLYEKSDTLLGNTIHYKKDKDSIFSLTINKSGILLSDGQSEINVEIGENGQEGNSCYISDMDVLTEKEISLIYEISIYQYKEFKREIENS